MSAVAIPSRFDQLEAAIANGAPHCMETVHHFSKSVYLRELRIPAGTLLTGKRHRHPCQNIVCGDITVYNDASGEERRITGHCVFESQAGTRRAGFAHAPTIWVTVHATEETDLDKIESEVIEPHVNVLIENRRAIT